MKSTIPFSLWPHQTKESWLQLIEEEKLNFPVTDQISAEAFAFHTDVIQEGTIANITNKQLPWKIGIQIELDSINIAKSRLDFALSQGAEYIHFLLFGIPTIDDLKFLLDGVHLDMITSHWELTDDCDCSDFENLLDKLNNANKSIFVSHSNKLHKTIIHSFGNFDINIWTKAIHGILSDLNRPHSAVENIIFKIELNNDFLTNVCLVRAIKLVINKLWKLLELKISIFYELTVNPNCLGENSHENLIKLASIGLSASISGADFIILPPPSYQEISNYKSALHIQHILKKEAYMDNMLDPLAGSYFVENLTEKIAELIWNEIKKLIVE